MSHNAFAEKAFLDYESVSGQLEHTLRCMDTLCADKEFKKVVGENAIRSFEQCADAIRRRMRQPFQLVVAGDFKRGKSTLINALLGESIAPMAVTSETVTFNKISYAEEDSIWLVLKNHCRIPLSREELSRENLERIINESGSAAETVNIHIRNEFLRDIMIVDTPGMGENMHQFDEQVEEYLANADALIYVVTARAPLSHTEQTFLSNIITTQNFPRVFLAVNMTDTLETLPDLNLVEDDTRRRAGAVSDRIYVYMISAKEELGRKIGNSSRQAALTETLENNFYDFETSLKDDVLSQKDAIKSARLVAIAILFLKNIRSHISLTRQMLDANVEKTGKNADIFRQSDERLRSTIEERKDEICGDIRDMKRETRGWMYDFMERLKAELRENAQTASVSDLQRYLQFYLMDMIKEAVMTCVRKHEKEINNRILDDAKEFSGSIIKELFGNVQSSIADNIADISWTNADNVVLAGTFIESVLGVSLRTGILAPFYLIGQTIAGSIRMKTVAARQEEIVKPILASFDRITDDVISNIDTMYRQLEQSARERIEQIYQRQLEASAEAFENISKAFSDENGKAENIRAILDEALETVEREEKELEQFQ